MNVEEEFMKIAKAAGIKFNNTVDDLDKYRPYLDNDLWIMLKEHTKSKYNCYPHTAFKIWYYRRSTSFKHIFSEILNGNI